MRHALLPIVTLLACIGQAGCQSPPKKLDESWLTPQTTRREVITKLGPPARFLDRNRVMAYRICGGQYADEAVCENTVGRSQSSLVIAFDGKGVYLKHRLVRLTAGDQQK